MRHFRYRPRLKWPVIGEARDVFGNLWFVRDIRTTKHGFDLLFGSRDEADRKYWGPPRLIATRELINYWEANRTNRDCVIFDLPAGRTTLKRVRRRFGFHLPNDVNAQWRARLDDLKTLKPREFAARYNMKVDVVEDARLRLLGRTARLLGWWQTPETLAILRSDLKLREIGQKLGIGTTHALRLKLRALELERETAAGQTSQEIRPAA
ncbi:MAG TPA: hypothetical protein VH640_02920 [Bryobacteraceae bacterium]